MDQTNHDIIKAVMDMISELENIQDYLENFELLDKSGNGEIINKFLPQIQKLNGTIVNLRVDIQNEIDKSPVSNEILQSISNQRQENKVSCQALFPFYWLHLHNLLPSLSFIDRMSISN